MAVPPPLVFLPLRPGPAGRGPELPAGLFVLVGLLAVAVLSALVFARGAP